MCEKYGLYKHKSQQHSNQRTYYIMFKMVRVVKQLQCTERERWERQEWKHSRAAY